jgi:AcrR family transcriptional regulator
MKRRLTRAEKRENTREGLIAAAEHLFVERGFHATAVDEVALEAGYTKGAVYSNFHSKEDLFFAVYERRVDRMVARIEHVLRETDPAAGIQRFSLELAQRRGHDDGWLAVFFEFWAHVVRHPELRERFAGIHARAQEPFVAAFERFAGQREVETPVDARGLAVAMYAMQIGLSLERLTQPEVVDVELGTRMDRFMFEVLEERGSAARDGKERP